MAKEKETTAEAEEKKVVVKKWKGKEWFDVMSPPDLGSRFIGQTPATDPKTVIGRNIEVGVSELLGDNSKYYMKLKLKIYKLQGKAAFTHFNGFECAREHLLRMVRKRSQKVETVVDVMTKDGWVIRFKPWIILRGNTASTIETKIRNMATQILNEVASKNSMSEILKKIISSEIQMMLKKNGSKIHPVRFAEIARIKVLRAPSQEEIEKIHEKETKKEEKAEEKKTTKKTSSKKTSKNKKK